ncbi:hypothetical protein [Mumia xiangluensis]|uniref:FtsK domain-containing protein n=1 Tax=Mumia xiangluensis TaxID=1678900 RepID=A0ABW1QTX5_9ACTN
MTVELAETREPSDLGRIGRLMLSQAARWRLAWVLVVVSLLVSYIGWGWHGLTGVSVLVVGGLYMSAHVEHFWPDVHAELVAPLRRIGWLAWLWYRWWPTVKGGGFARRERVMTDASDRVTWYGPRLRGLRVTRHGIRLAVRPPDGKTVEDIAKLGEALRDSMKADAVEVDARTRPGKLVVSLVMPSPLRDMRPLVEPMPWTGDFAAVPYGYTIFGEPACLRLKEVSGTVVGGLPGSGKTAGLSLVLATLAQSPAVQFAIFDGKGGYDWQWIEPRAAIFHRDDEDRAAMVEQLESLVAVMRDRLNRMPDLRGGASIWTTGGPSQSVPLLVIVVDECQTWLDPGAVSRGDKTAADLRQRAETAIATLVRKGRSAGIWCVPTTQKPTSDSLPTTIGSNAASAIAFRVKTPEAERAVLGSAPGDGDPSATDMPHEAGYAVVSTETGSRELVRFAHLEEIDLRRVATAVAHLRRTIDMSNREPHGDGLSPRDRTEPLDASP